MKIEATTLDITRSGTFKEQGFSIANNSKAFDILSSKIYTDVPLAIVREISTNASDSHVDAGCPDKPFEVHLPNNLEPWLMIRDFGTGLSPEHVETIYTTYFKSTRSTSDAFTGCLGLGSKSPFAYADQFMIISNWNGRKYTYSAFKNEEGCPTLSLLGEVDTDEHNGLEIRISIKPGDAQRFIDSARKVYQHFNVRPTITGATITFDENKPVVSDADYALLENGSGNVYVIMGQVRYAVGRYSVPGLPGVGSGATLYLNLPIGSCSISASREEIHYDPKTIEAVRAAACEAMDRAAEFFKEAVEGETSVWAKIKAIGKYRNLHPNLTIKAGISVIHSFEQDKYSMKACRLRRGDKLYIEHMGNFDYYKCGNNYVFLEDDTVDGILTQNLKNRIRAYMHKNDAEACLVKIQDRARFIELFGDAIVAVTTLPDVPKVPRTPNARTSARSKPVKLLSDYTHGNMNFEWKNIHAATEVDPKNACSVIRDGTWVIWEGQRVKPNVVRRIATALGFERVYGISDKRYATLRPKLGLDDLATVAKDRAQKLIDGLDKHALAKMQHDMPDNLYRMPVDCIVGLSDECDDFFKMYNADIDNMGMYQEMCSQFGIEMPKAPDFSKAFFEKYTILLAIDWHSSNMTKTMTINY